MRAIFLAQRESVPFPRVVGTILLEKLFDFLALGGMIALLVLIAPLPPAALVAATSVSTVILLGFGFVVALAVWRGPTLRLVRWGEGLLPQGVRARVRISAAAEEFAAGTDSLRRPSLWLALLGWTVVAWIGAVVSGVAGFLAIGISLSLPALLFLLILTSTGQAVPSSPGYVGVYHGAAVIALTAFGVAEDSALAGAVLLHAVTYGTMVLAGLVALWVDGYQLQDLLVGLNPGRAKASTPTPNA